MLVYRLNFVIIGEKFLVECSVQSKWHLLWGSCCHVETSLSPMLPPLGAIMRRHGSLFWAWLEPGLWPSCLLCLSNHHLRYPWAHAYKMPHKSPSLLSINTCLWNERNTSWRCAIWEMNLALHLISWPPSITKAMDTFFHFSGPHFPHLKRDNDPSQSELWWH